MSTEHRRCLLHKNQKAAFEQWLVADGWDLLPPVGYQVIRAFKGPRSFIAYERHCGDHLTVQNDKQSVVRAFLRSKKEGAKS